jgi:hypothetical protein
MFRALLCPSSGEQEQDWLKLHVKMPGRAGFTQEMKTFLYSVGISYLFIALILMQHKGQNSENFVACTVWLA